MTNFIDVENLSLTLDYETGIATVVGDLLSIGTGGDGTYTIDDGVVIYPLFSADQLSWQRCVLGSALPVAGFAASPTGEPFSFEWDFRDVLPSTGDPIDLYLTVVGYFPGDGPIPEHFGQSPVDDAILTSVGPEQFQTTATPVNPDLTVIEETELLEYYLGDRDSEDVNVTVEYSIDGGVTWSECTEGVGGDGTISLSTSPGGTLHTFAWDTLADGVRGQRVLVRVSPYKQLRPSPSIYTDYRFSDRVLAAYNFEEDAAPVSVVAGDYQYPSMLYGDSKGNREPDHDGTVDLDGSSRLALTCDADERAALGFPRHGFSPSVARALLLDVQFDIGTAESLAVEIVAPGNKVVARIMFSTAGGLVLEVSSGKASYVISAAAEVYAGATEYNARLTLKPGDGQTTVNYVRDGVPVSLDPGSALDFVFPKNAEIFDVDSVCFRAVAQGSLGTVAYIHRLVLLDDDQFTGAHAVPTGDDPRESDWLGNDWWPRSADGVFVGNTAASGDYSAKTGQNGQALALLGNLEIPNTSVGKRRKFRTDLFSHGFGLELHVNVPVGYLMISLLDSAASYFELEFGDNLGVAARVVDVLDATTELIFQNDSEFFSPALGVWYHVRFSVRRYGPEYLMALSVNGSKPSYALVPELPKLFNPSGDSPTGYRLLFELMSFSGTDPVLIDDLKVWDGYHMSPYPIPVPESPQTEYWKP